MADILKYIYLRDIYAELRGLTSTRASIQKRMKSIKNGIRERPCQNVLMGNIKPNERLKKHQLKYHYLVGILVGVLSIYLNP